MTEFDSKLAHLHQENIKYINSSIDYGAYFNPYINEYTSEWTEFTNLLRTCGNMELNRVLMVLANLCQEMYSLSRIGLDQYIYPLAFYGEERKVSCDNQEINENGLDGPGLEFLLMSKLFPILFDLLCYLRRCNDVIRNLIFQMQELFTR